MKTTLHLDPQLLARLKKAAARQGKTMSELVEAAIRTLLAEQRETIEELPPLPTFASGGAVADLANRDDLHRAMAGLGY